MEHEIVLTPEELYCLGVRMKAKYIDYAYVAAMKETGKDFSFFERLTEDGLIKKGIMEEDFGGNVEISEEVKMLLTPVFFGEMETSVDVCKLQGNQSVSVNKFHFCNGMITQITGENGKLKIRVLSGTDEIRRFADALLPHGCVFSEKRFLDALEPEKLEYFYSVKSLVIGKTSAVYTFMESDNEIWRENEQKKLENISAEEFAAVVFDTIKGV